MKYLILVICAYTVCAANGDIGSANIIDDDLELEDSEDSFNDDILSENFNPLHQYRDDSCTGKIRSTCSLKSGTCVSEPFNVTCSQGTIFKQGCQTKNCACCVPEKNHTNETCSGRIRATCSDQGGSCVAEPFDVNCSQGRIKPQGCETKHCACCLPALPRQCETKATKKCTKAYGSCVVAPFKQNCKDGTLFKKWCKSKYCQCCVPDVTPAPPTICPPIPLPVTCPPPPPPATCPPPITCPQTSPPVTCPPTPPPVTCPPTATCPTQANCHETPSPATCPPPPPTPTCPQVNETETCADLPKSFIDWENCTSFIKSPTEVITDLDESYYLSHNFVYQNGHLILKPRLGEYFNWLDSIKRCQDLHAEPLIPKSQDDWDMLRDISQNIGDTENYNMWLPASDRGTEGLLKWLPVDVASDDPLMPWNRCTKMKTNRKGRDCLQLWSGNGYRVTLDACANFETPHHYYPMVCQATFNGASESFYLSNNFTYENGILALKPAFGQYMTWLESITRCRNLKSEPFVPSSEADWEWLRILSSKIDDPLPHNLWLPASDRNEEGTLKWLPTKDATHDPLISWVKGEVMRMNSDRKDCLQLWSGNGHYASMDECDKVDTPNHYYPMVCKASFRSITTKL